MDRNTLASHTHEEQNHEADADHDREHDRVASPPSRDEGYNALDAWHLRRDARQPRQGMAELLTLPAEFLLRRLGLVQRLVHHQMRALQV